MRKIFQVFAVFFLLLACDGDQNEITDTIGTTSIPQYTLAVTDSIGIEMGDSAYVFGSVMDTEILPDGNIMVLDGAYCKIRVYSPEGEHIRSFSGQGNGPGELVNPFNLYNWGNGEVGVIDVYAGGIHRFTTEGEWLGLDLQITNSSFIGPIVTEQNKFVSFKSRFFQEGDAIYATAFVGLFPLTIDPEVTYWEKTVPWDPANMGNLANELLFNSFYTADPTTGRIFVSPFNEDNYSILCYEPDGSSAGTITADYTPVPKTEEEIQAESDFIEFFLRTSESNNPNMNYDCTPWPNHLAVTGLYMGPGGNLWAMRGGMDVPTFDIWNENHELVGTATIPGLPSGGSNWKFVFGPNHTVAWNENPESFQKLYILTMD